MKFLKKLHNIYLLLFVVLNFALSQIPQNDIIEISENHPLSFHLTNVTDNNKYFKFTLTKIEKDQDLAILALPLDFKSDPDLFISRSETHPSLRSSEERCILWGYDICFIPKNQLVLNSIFYVAVHCDLECKFSIEIKYSEEKLLKFGVKNSFFFLQNDNIVFKVNIPNILSMKHFSIFLEIDKYLYETEQDVKMYVNQGDEPPTTSNTLPVFMTEYGHIYSTFEERKDFCRNCNYTILVTAKKNTMIYITIKDTSGRIDINLGETYFDAMTIGYNLTYVLDAKKNNISMFDNKLNETLFFSLLTTQGNPDLFINCDILPENLNQYRWRSTTYGMESIMISADEFQEDFKSNQCNIIYITVYATSCAAYGLKVNSFTNNYLPITPGMMETGYIRKKENMNYFLLLQSNKNLNITISLHASQGDPDLFFRECKSDDSDECFFDISSFNNNKNEYKTVSSQNIGDDIIHFNHEGKNCYALKFNEKEIFCYYLITVSGGKGVLEDTEFRLLISIDRNQVNLREQNPIKNFLNVGEFAYYKFTLLDTTDITSVNFQVTPIYGAPELFSSRSIEYPGFGRFERVACFCMNLINYDYFNTPDKNLKATYFISVYAISATMYTLNVILERNTTDLEHVIRLFNSVPQKTNLKNDEEIAFYEFSVEKNSDYMLDLIITPIKGIFNIYVLLVNESKSELMPSATVYNWTTKSNHLMVNRKWKGEAFKDLYRVGVVPISDNISYDYYQWNIVFSTSDKIINLIPGHRYSTENLRVNKSLSFKFEVYETDVSVHITLQSMFDQAIFDISSSSKAFNSSNLNYSFIYIDQSTIKQECQNKKICYFYAFLATKSKENIDASLLLVKNLDKENELILLDYDNNFDLPLPKQNHGINFYFYPSYSNQSMINILSFDGILETAYSVIDTSKFPMRSDWKIPEFKTVENIKKDSQSSSYSYNKKFEKKEFGFCVPNCVVIFSVKTLLKVHESTIFSINLGTMISELRNGIAIIDNVRSKQMNYYVFKNKINTTTLKIMVSPLSNGNPLLYINFENGVPCNESYHWISVERKDDSYMIDFENNKKFFINYNNSMIGKYYIGVSSNSNLNYQISISSNLLFAMLMRGIPSGNMIVEKKERKSFIYKKKSFTNDCKLFIYEYFGFGEIFVKLITKDKVPEDNQPNANNYDYKYDTNDRTIVLFDKEKNKECFGNECLIIISFQAIEKSKLSLVINDMNSIYLKYGLNFVDHFDIKTDLYKYYYILTQDFSDVFLQCTILSGKIEIAISLLPEEEKEEFKYNQFLSYSESDTNNNLILIPNFFNQGKHTIQIKIKGSYSNTNQVSYMLRPETRTGKSYLQENMLVQGVLEHLNQTNIYNFETGFYSNDMKLGFYLEEDQIVDYNQTLAFKFYVKGNLNAELKEINDLMTWYSNFNNIIFNLPHLNDTAYHFTVSLKNQTKKIKYSLILSKGSIYRLPKFSQFSNSLLKDEADTFQILSDQPGLLIFHISNCFGSININGSSTLAHLKEKNYDATFKYLSECNHTLYFNIYIFYIILD